MRKTLAFIGMVIILGAGLALAQEADQSKARKEIRKQAEIQKEDGQGTLTRTKTRIRNRIRFLDENGDGINDLLFRDHDGDGIPNGQDPDWEKPQDGTGYQDGNRFQGENGQLKKGPLAGQQTQAKTWTKKSFRAGQSGMWGIGTGTGACTKTGPKGKAVKRGRG